MLGKKNLASLLTGLSEYSGMRTSVSTGAGILTVSLIAAR